MSGPVTRLQKHKIEAKVYQEFRPESRSTEIGSVPAVAPIGADPSESVSVTLTAKSNSSGSELVGKILKILDKAEQRIVETIDLDETQGVDESEVTADVGEPEETEEPEEAGETEESEEEPEAEMANVT